MYVWMLYLCICLADSCIYIVDTFIPFMKKSTFIYLLVLFTVFISLTYCLSVFFTVAVVVFYVNVYLCLKGFWLKWQLSVIFAVLLNFIISKIYIFLFLWDLTIRPQEIMSQLTLQLLGFHITKLCLVVENNL